MAMDSWVNRRQLYDAVVREIEPASRLVTKDHWIWNAVWWSAAIATFGLFAVGMPKKRFFEDYATTLFPIQGYPKHWESLSTRLLIHECRHTAHCVWLGYLIPVLGWIPGSWGRHIRAWCGAPFYVLLYLFLILPVGFAIFRWLIELDCEITAWKWQLDYHYKPDQILSRAIDFGNRVCSGHYLWAWLPIFGGVDLYETVAKGMIDSWKSR